MNSIISGLKIHGIIIAILGMLASPLFLHANMNKSLITTSNNSNDSINHYETKYKRDHKKLRITTEALYLRTTHTTKFKGADVIGSYLLTPSLSVGFGVEYSYISFHFDNNYNLTHVNFYPVFLDSRLDVTKNTLFTPFLHLSTGITFAKYIKENIDDLGKFYHVSETGLYLYSGIGVSYKINSYISTFIELGFKGYHMSFHDLDVNPHGLAIRLGLNF